MNGSALTGLADRFERGDGSSAAPPAKSFVDFLTNYARVKSRDGAAPYTFEGREALLHVARHIDRILGSSTGKPLPDATLAICGGAQFGKTILILLLAAYLTGVQYRNIGIYLPDDDLVQGIVDGKFRPEIVDLHPWFAQMLSLGKTVNESGKSVNRKGAFMVSNGAQRALGYIRGMGKIPTSFSMDVTLQDEKDDIDPNKAKYVSGRTAASDLRFGITIGTQRFHGLGQNKEFVEGTQEVMVFRNTATGRVWNLEENFPQVVRLQMGTAPSADDPKLSHEGDFKRDGVTVAEYDPDGIFYLADPDDGTPLDRTAPEVEVRRPDRERLRKFSVRIPQLAIAAVSLQQVVNRWQAAIRDPEMMIVFRCEVLADPQSTRQALTPALIDRARTLEPFDMSLAASGKVFAGLDTGDRCWFVGAETLSAVRQRIIWAERISSDRLLARILALVETLGVSCLFVDAGPLRDTSRAIVFSLNGLDSEAAAQIESPERAYIRFTDGLVWNGPSGRWENLRAAAVEFTLKPGSGLRHKLGKTDEGRLYPVISASREDTIGGVINDLLTAQEGVVELIDKKLRTEPKLLLPRQVPGSPAAVEDLANHFLAGSKRVENGGFVDKVENHYLLASGYARMARMPGGMDPSTGKSTVTGIGHSRLATSSRKDW